MPTNSFIILTVYRPSYSFYEHKGFQSAVLPYYDIYVTKYNRLRWDL